MKKYLIVFCLCGINLVLTAQPNKVWSKIFGGNNSDVCTTISQYNDTMLIAAGKSASTNVGGNKGADDFMVCQFRPNGDQIRIKTFGGPQIEQISSYVTLANGNLILGGFTNGKGSDVSNLYGLTDIWVVGYNPHTGTKLWEKSIGGTNNDQCNDLFYLEPGRVFIAGHTKSLDKDVVASPTKGGNDVLITSIDENGAIIKAFTFGGTKDETAKKILRSDAFGGQMLVFGESESNDMDFNGLSKGKKDIFILKINRNINKVFLTTIGGPGDDLFGDAINLGDNGMIIFGTVATPGGQVDSLKGAKDIWMAKLDKNGVLEWTKNIGGKNDETSVKAQLDKDGNIIFLGNSNSRDQDITGNYGGSDVLLMKLDTSGTILWQKNYGGTAGDNAGAFCFGTDGSVYVVSQSFSINNDLPANNTAAPDFWTLKVFECTAVESNHTSSVCIGDTILINGRKYYSGFESGVDTLKRSTINGCDSIVHVTVIVNPSSINQIVDTLCYDDSVRINNVVFTRQNPIQTFKLSNQYGCDSFLLVDLLFNSELLLKDSIITKDDGNGTGCITIEMEGGCQPYSYHWNNGVSGPLNCNLVTGVYTVEVKDCLGCTKIYTFKVGTTVGNNNGIPEPFQYLVTNEKILVQSNLESIVSYELISSDGRIIQSRSVRNAHFELIRSDIPRGWLNLNFKLKNGQIRQFSFVN
ncbi:MAG: hypothetical protein IPJ80_12715 [Saprospiraceae bacterium]|nr:hypothetical protein [Saprospiraceae bacterium]MBK7914344.1 hypothetical protein [Saprospiraceae bacterium]